MILTVRLQVIALVILSVLGQYYCDSTDDMEEFQSMVIRRVENLETKNLDLQKELDVFQESIQSHKVVMISIGIGTCCSSIAIFCILKLIWKR